METLTAKQVANRLYYSKNAEKIKAQKRASYAEKKAANPVPVRKAKSYKQATKKVSAKPEITTTKTVRNRIEDFKLAQEFGIEVSDL